MRTPLLISALLLLAAQSAFAQLAPDIGYMIPPGGVPGSTVDVVLGGYDWTPDMQVFVHDPRVKLVITGKPGPVIVAEPPYWFGARGRGPAFNQPREVSAKLSIAADVPLGVIDWQVANANGASPRGKLLVAPGPEIMEAAKHSEPQVLASLPISVSGQLKKIEEVDRYRFTAAGDDVDMCWLLHERGWTLGFNPAAMVAYWAARRASRTRSCAWRRWCRPTFRWRFGTRT